MIACMVSLWVHNTYIFGDVSFVSVYIHVHVHERSSGHQVFFLTFIQSDESFLVALLFNLVFIQLSFCVVGVCRLCRVPRQELHLQQQMTLNSSQRSSRLPASQRSILSLHPSQCLSACSPMAG